MTVQFDLNGQQVTTDADGASLLDVLRDEQRLRSVKDGCSPQGQCGCCTVLVDGAARVSCVTPVRRVAGRSVTTLEGLDEADRQAWGEAFCATGASQCGFCTPGIILRLEALAARDGGPVGGDAGAAAAGPSGGAAGPSGDAAVGTPGATAEGNDSVDRALAAHLCRCTGWRTIAEAYDLRLAGSAGSADAASPSGSPSGSRSGPPVGSASMVAGRDLEAAGRRATIEGRAPQRVSPAVALGEAGFADDTAPAGALLVAVRGADGDWVVGEGLTDARRRAGKVQGRRTTVEATPPLDLPDDDWVVALRTSWVEPGYLETDASWCVPGGEPAGPLANGGAFGGKVDSPVAAVARRLADEHGRAVRVLLSREDTVRLGPKRPPVAIGIRADGTGVVRVARTTGVAAVIAAYDPGLVIEEVDLPGPATSIAVRAAGWAEVAVARAAWVRRTASAPAESSGSAGSAGSGGPRGPAGPVTVVSPEGARASASVAAGGRVALAVACGEVLDAVVLRSYLVGAAHQAIGWVTSEGLAVDGDGVVQDLTVRSFGILRAGAMPDVDVDLTAAVTLPAGALDRLSPDVAGRAASVPAAAVNGSDAAFAAVAAAVWCQQGFPSVWPTGVAWPPGRG